MNRIVIDIDGTIADSMGLAHSYREQGKDWDAFLADNIFIPVLESPYVDLINTIHDYHDHSELIIWTGRRDRWRAVTEQWLSDNEFDFHDELVMRPTESPLRSSDWKRTKLEEWGDVLLVIDDDVEVHEHCVELKIGNILVKL